MTNELIKTVLVNELARINTDDAQKLINLIEGKFLSESDIALSLLKTSKEEYLNVLIKAFSPSAIKRYWQDWSFSEYFKKQPLNSMSRVEAHNYNTKRKEEEKSRKTTMLTIIDKRVRNPNISGTEKSEWYMLGKFLKGCK